MSAGHGSFLGGVVYVTTFGSIYIHKWYEAKKFQVYRFFIIIFMRKAVDTYWAPIMFTPAVALDVLHYPYT